MTLTQLLNNVGGILSDVLEWIPEVFDTMIASPIVLVFLGLAIVGTVVAFAKRILM